MKKIENNPQDGTLCWVDEKLPWDKTSWNGLLNDYLKINGDYEEDKIQKHRAVIAVPHISRAWEGVQVQRSGQPVNTGQAVWNLVQELIDIAGSAELGLELFREEYINKHFGGYISFPYEVNHKLSTTRVPKYGDRLSPVQIEWLYIITPTALRIYVTKIKTHNESSRPEPKVRKPKTGIVKTEWYYGDFTIWHECITKIQWDVIDPDFEFSGIAPDRVPTESDDLPKDTNRLDINTNFIQQFLGRFM